MIVPFAAASAAMAVSLAAVSGLGGWLGAGLALIMVAIALFDARRFVIPDALNAAGLALGLAHAAIAGAEEGAVVAALAASMIRAAVVAASFGALWLLYRRLRGREGLGLGDVKLAAVAGAWLDWTVVPLAVEVAALAGLAGFAWRRRVCRRPVGPRTRMPFGLFFAPAIWLGWLVQSTVLAPS